MKLPRKLSFFFLVAVPTLAPPAALAQQSCLDPNVSAYSTPDGDFTDNHDGTVTHSKTGLMWKQCVEGLSGAGCATGSTSRLDWPGALQAAASSTFANHDDWRLPNIKELASIVETACASPSINANRFPNDPGDDTWSSTPYAANSNALLLISFEQSFNRYSINMSSTAYVRLVRGGQAPAAYDQSPSGFGRFTSQSNVAVSSTVTSNDLTLSGLPAPTAISVSNGSYAINHGSYTTAPGTVSNGDIITVQHTAAATGGASLTTTVTLGTLMRSFTSTTAGADITPPVLNAVGVSGTTTTATTFSATSDETATGYWVVLPDAAPAPAVAQVKLGQDSTNAAAPFSGHAAMAANGAQTFNISGLTVLTAYKVYFVATDTSNNDTTVQTVSFTTSAAPDTTPPVLSAIGLSGTTDTATTLAVTSDETATGYWVALPAATYAPGVSQVKAGQDGNYVAAPFLGNDTMVANVAQTFTISGLHPATDYKVYFVATDTAGNDSAVQTESFATVDTIPPVLSAVGVSGTTPTSTTLAATSDETATGYWVVLPDAAPAPVAAQVKLGQDSTNAAAPFSGNAAMVATVAKIFSISGLTAVTDYKAYFVARDTAGNEAAMQTLSFSTLAVSAPDAPTGVSASAGDGQATVSFSAPANDGGSAITGYTVVSDPVGGVDAQAGSTSTTHTLTSLTNGTAYTFTVIASNSLGDSVASAASAAVTPAVAVPPPPPTPTPTPTPTTVNVNGSGAVTLDGALPVHIGDGSTGAVLTVNTAAPLTFTVNGADVTVQASSGSVVEVAQVTVNGQTVLALVVTQGSITLTASQAGQVLLMSGAGAVQAADAGTTVVAGPNQIAVVIGSVKLPDNAFAAGAITTLYAGEVAQLNDAGKITSIRLGSADGQGGLVGDPLPLSDKPSSLTVGIAVPRLSGALGRLPGGLEAALASVLGGSGRQNSAGSFNLAGSPAFNLLPLGDIVIDGTLADGIKLSPDGLARIVKDSVAVTLAPAPRDLYQFAADLAQAVPGATLSVGAGGVLIAHLPPDLRYVVRPAQLVEAVGGPAGFSSGQDGVLRYDDGQGGQQALNPAFLDYAATRALLDGVIPDAQATVEADGSISLTLGNSRFRLTPDPLLTPLDSSSALHMLNGEKWWLGTDGKVYLNVGGAVQGVEIR